MSDINPFISKFCRWAAQGGLPKNRRARFSSALRKAIAVELPARDDKIQIEIRSLQNSDQLRCTYKSKDIWLFSGLDDLLKIGVVAPPWGEDWDTITKDEMVVDAIENFFHFARQYIVRSRIVGVIGAIVLTYGRACEFRYEMLYRLPVCHKDSHKSIWAMMPQDEYRLKYRTFCAKNGKYREFLAWVYVGVAAALSEEPHA